MLKNNNCTPTKTNQNQPKATNSDALQGGHRL